MSLLEDLAVISVKEAATIHSPKGRYLEMQNRKYYGLSFCRSGEIIYTHKGKRIHSDPSCAVLLPMGESYFLEGSRTGDFPLINFTCGEGQMIGEFLQFPVHNLEGYLRDYEMIRELLLLGHDRLKVMSLFYGILSRLARETTERNSTLATVLSYLEAHYSDPQLSNLTLAEQGGISEVYMRQLFREQLSVSPKQYISELRMQKAKQMLSEGTATVGEVAARCGFTSIYHFCRAFKAYAGQSPTDYRRDNRKILL
ncbi:MAG: helix-turn-helix transcriptional regulator [Clostridia bacterium]|nr:helix-turn-helix transcriptional regulator [Clostridia bacterium]